MEWFDRVHGAQLDRLATANPPMVRWLREIGAIYLYGSIGIEAVLLPDGSVRVWRADNWPESDQYTERTATNAERIGGLVLGARRIPEIIDLLPTRRGGSVDCVECGGRGDILGGILCPKCTGLGWY